MDDGRAVIARFEQIIAKAAESYRADTRFLAILRIAYASWILLLPVDVMWMADIPDGFINPRPGLFMFVSSAPDWGVLFAISAIRIVLAVLLAVGLFTVPVSIALTCCMILVSGLSYSYSKVDHFILFELTPVFLAFAGWGRRCSVDALRRRTSPKGARGSGLPVLLFAMTIGWAMLSAAAPKMLGGWMDPSRQATRGYIARDIAVGVKPGILGEWILSIDFTPFWKAMDYATLVVEAGLIFFVFTPLLYRLWLLLLSFFHIGVYLMLDISFIDYALVYAVFFSPALVWSLRRIRRLWGNRKQRVKPAQAHSSSAPERPA